MTKHNQVGAVSGLGISLILAIVLLIAALAFGGWAYSSRQDYKNHTDGKVAAAVTVAKQQEASAKDVQFKEDEKKPLRTYNGPEAYGSMVLQYPKTWSGYVDETGKNTALVDGYFYPNVVPSITGQNSVFALRVQVLNQAYADVATKIASAQKSTAQTKNATPLKISPYALPKVPKVVGMQLSGTLPLNGFSSNSGRVGMMVVLPLRSETLELWTESPQFQPDFTNNILPNFSFSP